MTKRFLFFSFFILALSFLAPLAAQQPVNSNYLIANGISPRMLDAATSLFMQDGRFTVEVNYRIEEGDSTRTYHLLQIYDPAYEEGMDIRVVNLSEPMTKKEKKKLRRYIEASHYFSRMSRNYLYDESSLKEERRHGDTLVLSFLYQKKDIDPYLRNIRRLRGEAYLVNGHLNKVVLKNVRPLKKGVVSYERTVTYAPADDGGYIVTGYHEESLRKKGSRRLHISVTATTGSYRDPAGRDLTWQGQPASPQTAAETLNVKLGGVLPLLGKEATKLGYQLPRPFGTAAFVYNHSQNMQFTGLQVALDDGQMVDLNNLFILDDSRVTQTTFMPLVKADVWLFPFLNIMAIVGGGQNDLDGELVINEELRDFLNNLPGWIVDIPNIPRAIPIRTSVTSEVYGGGVTLAGGVGSFNLSVNYQLMFTKMVEANTTNMVNVITPMAGYMAPFGINFMLGGQGQFYNTRIKGYLDLVDEDGIPHKLHYNVEFEPIQWNAIVGLYKNFSKHWEMSIQAGFGQRNSLTAIFGYRF